MTVTWAFFSGLDCQTTNCDWRGRAPASGRRPYPAPALVPKAATNAEHWSTNPKGRLRPTGSRLLEDLGDAAGAHGPATLTDREPQPLIHRDRVDQRHRHVRVVTRHAHLRALRQLDRTRDVRGPEEELGPVVGEERLDRKSTRLNS